MIITASLIIPVTSPPIADGYIYIENNRIKDFGPAHDLPTETGIEIRHYPDSILAPGFINAHCHLELTALGPLEIINSVTGQPHPFGSIPFVPWIRKVMEKKRQLTQAQISRGILQGMEALRQSGVIAVGDHVSFDTDLEPYQNCPLRGVLFGEVLGVNYEVSKDNYQILKQKKATFDQFNSPFEFRISPHSVHAVNPKVLHEVMVNEVAPQSMHLAESREEAEYFKHRTGPLAEVIQGMGLLNKHDGISTWDYLIRNQLPIAKVLAVHGNTFTSEELHQLKRFNTTIVHCPTSHTYFGHPPFPWREVRELGIPIALGTDSLASHNDLNFLSELNRIAQNCPALSVEEILTMATLNGARALGIDKEVGSFERGKRAHWVRLQLGDRIEKNSGKLFLLKTDKQRRVQVDHV